jgi:hypothetical protein
VKGKKVNSGKYKIKIYYDAGGKQQGRLVNIQTGIPIPEGEPVVIFRGQDKHLPTLLREYYVLCNNGMQSDAIAERSSEIEAWQKANPDKVKEPD